MSDTLQLFTANSGKLSARVLFEDQTVRHLHSTVAPEQESRFFSGLHPWGDTILLLGTGLGYHLDRMVKHLSPSTRIIVVDYFRDLAEKAAERLLRQRDNPRMLLWHGCRYEEELRRFLRSGPAGKMQVVRHPASFHAHPDFYESMLGGVLREHNDIRQRSGGQPSGDRKSVLLMHGTFFLEPELAAAARQSAYPVDTIDYRRHCSSFSFESALQRTLETSRPSAIVSVNMKGFDSEGILSGSSKQRGIPLYIWFVDDPRPIVEPFGGQIGSHMVAACWERHYLPFLKRCGFGTVIHLPLAGDPSFCGDGAVTSSVPFGFVGSSMGEPFLGPMRENFLWSESLQPMVDRFSDLVAADRSTAATTNLVKACNTAGYEVPFKDARNQAWFWSYCIHTASMKQRRKAVNAAIPAGIELFGDPEGWRRLLGNRVTLHPSVDYQSQLASTYAAIDVNLNSTSCQMPTAVNQRVFDIPLAGSFVLSDNQPDLFELFEESSEVIVYHDPQEIPSLAAYYQQHPELRRAISARAKQRIVAEHTYAKRLERLLSTV